MSGLVETDLEKKVYDKVYAQVMNDLKPMAGEKIKEFFKRDVPIESYKEVSGTDMRSAITIMTLAVWIFSFSYYYLLGLPADKLTSFLIIQSLISQVLGLEITWYFKGMSKEDKLVYDEMMGRIDKLTSKVPTEQAPTTTPPTTNQPTIIKT